MITNTSSALTGMLLNASAAAAREMPSSEPLTPGAPARDLEPLPEGTQAVVAPFAGARSGELLVVVDAELAAALQSAPVPLDLAAALAPTMTAVAAAIGNVTLGQAEVSDARAALQRVLSAAESAVVPLLGSGAPRAAVALALTPGPAVPAADVTSPDRLDLLRSVEMDATAELGRTRMTVNDLLALRAGAVVELDRVAGGPADLLVNGRLIARGEVVVVDENYGIRITQVVTDAAGR